MRIQSLHKQRRKEENRPPSEVDVANGKKHVGVRATRPRASHGSPAAAGWPHRLRHLALVRHNTFVLQFGHVGPSRAAALLPGKRLVFIGDSQSGARHLWALVDAVGGAKKAIRRQYGHTVADSHREFDQAAVALDDTLYDSQRAYHAGQTVLLNVDTGRWKLIDPGQLCGVGKKYWMTDHRLVGALRKGHPSPWHLMRGSQYRLRLRVVPKAGGRKANGQEPRRAVEALARELMHGWDSCKKVSIRDCSYHEAMQRNCARRLSVSKDDTKKASASDDDDEIPLVVTMGEMGGVCQRAANHLQRLLESSLADASTGGRGGGGGGRVAMSDEMQQEGGSPTRRRLLGLKSDGKRRGMTTKSAAAARAAAAALAGKSGGGKSRQMSSSWRREQLMGALSSQAKASLAMLRRSGPVVVDPICVSYCRETAHLECPKDGPTYEQAVEKAAREVSHELAHHEAASPFISCGAHICVCGVTRGRDDRHAAAAAKGAFVRPWRRSGRAWSDVGVRDAHARSSSLHQRHCSKRARMEYRADQLVECGAQSVCECRKAMHPSDGAGDATADRSECVPRLFQSPQAPCFGGVGQSD